MFTPSLRPASHLTATHWYSIMQSEPLPLICDRCSTEDPYLKAKSCHWKRGAECSEAQATQREGDLAMCPCIGSRSQIRPSKPSRSSSESVATAQHDGQQPGQHTVYSSAKVSITILDEGRFIESHLTSFGRLVRVRTQPAILTMWLSRQRLRVKKRTYVRTSRYLFIDQTRARLFLCCIYQPHVLPYPSDCESRPSTDLSASLSAEGYSTHFSCGLMLKVNILLKTKIKLIVSLISRNKKLEIPATRRVCGVVSPTGSRGCCGGCNIVSSVEAMSICVEIELMCTVLVTSVQHPSRLTDTQAVGTY